MLLRRSARSVGGRVPRSLRMPLCRTTVIACTGICTPWQFSGSHTASDLAALGDCGRISCRSLQQLGPHEPWFRWTLRIPILPRDLARAANHWRSGQPSYPLPCDWNQPAASHTLGANARHHNCVSRTYSPIYRNLIRYLHAVGTPAVCFRPGVRADSCRMTRGPVDHSHSTYARLKPVR